MLEGRNIRNWRKYSSPGNETIQNSHFEKLIQPKYINLVLTWMHGPGKLLGPWLHGLFENQAGKLMHLLQYQTTERPHQLFHQERLPLSLFLQLQLFLLLLYSASILLALISVVHPQDVTVTEQGSKRNFHSKPIEHASRKYEYLQRSTAKLAKSASSVN